MSQNGSKMGRVHRVHSPRPARRPRPRAQRPCRTPAAQPALPGTLRERPRLLPRPAAHAVRVPAVSARLLPHACACRQPTPARPARARAQRPARPPAACAYRPPALPTPASLCAHACARQRPYLRTPCALRA